LESFLEQQKGEIKNLEQTKRKYKESLDGIRAQNRILQEEKFKYEDALKEATDLRAKLDKFRSVELAVKGLDGDLNQFLSERGAFDRKTKDLATLVVVLKKKLGEVKKEKNVYEGRVRETTGKHEKDKRRMNELEKELVEAQVNNKSLESNLWRVQEDLRNMTERVERQDDEDDDTLVIAEEKENCLEETPSSPVGSLSPPSPARKLPSFKLVGSVKRTLSPDNEEKLLPVMSHSSARLRDSSDVQYKRQKSSSLHYDGLGGRSKVDEFPQARARGLFTSSQSFKSSKTLKVQKTKLSSMTIKQNKTIDKFFGSFDTP